MRIINRQARHDFTILDKLEAGIVLTGAEIKSIRAGRVALSESHVRIISNEAFLINAFINPWMGSEKQGQEATRSRKLLLHRAEIASLIGKLSGSDLTLIPLSIYLKKNLAKVEIALARSKKKYEKREILRKRAIERDVARELRGDKLH